MNVGLFFILQHPEWKTEAQVVGETLEQIEYAEELGFESVWLAEHHFTRHGICGSPLQFLANVAARTRRIRLGLAIAVLPFQHPIHTAEQSAMLDILSNGRLDFGVGRGYLESEFTGFGLKQADSTTLFQESVDIIRGAWTQERFSYHGKHYNFENLRIAPKPLQQPHPPIFAATISPHSLSWAIDNNFPMLTGALTPFPDVKAAHVYYRAELARRGADPTLYARSTYNRAVVVAETTEEARALAGPALEWQAATVFNSGSSAQGGQYANDYEYYRQLDQMKQQQATMQWTDEVWADAASTPAVGDPDEVLRRLRILQDELGLQTLMARMNLGGIEHHKVMRSMELFAHEVWPRLGMPTAAAAEPTSDSVPAVR